MKRALWLVAKATLTALLIWWVARSVDVHSITHTLGGLDASVLLLALLLTLSQALLLGWRWHRMVLLLGGALPPANAMRWVFMGLFFNQVLPTSVGGDAARVWKLHQSGASLKFAFGSVMVERVSGLALMGLMILICLPAVWGHLDNPLLRAALLMTGPTLIAGLMLATLADKLPLRRLPARWAQLLLTLCTSLRRIADRPLALVEVSVLSLLVSLAGFVAAYALGMNLGIDLSLPSYVVLVGGAVLLSVLPISLGGWGVRELSMVSLFGAVGVEAERALALSLVWGVLPLLVSLPGGFLWWLDGRSVSKAETP